MQSIHKVFLFTLVLMELLRSTLTAVWIRNIDPLVIGFGVEPEDRIFVLTDRSRFPYVTVEYLHCCRQWVKSICGAAPCRI